MELMELPLIADVCGETKYPTIEEYNFWHLANNRIFYVETEIDERILELQKFILHFNLIDKGVEKELRKPIYVILDTPGGLLSESMSVATTIANSTTPVYTVNVAEAYSGGAILLIAGQKRFCMPYSKAMIHTGSGGVSGTFEQTEAMQKVYKKQVDEMGRFILERSGMDAKLFNRNKSKDWYFDASEQENLLGCTIIQSLDEII